MIHLDRSCYLERYGDPATWSGDWRREGEYLDGDRQRMIHERMEHHRRLIIALAVRGIRSSIIAAVFVVSRESVDRRLRPLGLKGKPGEVGRPVRRAAA